VIVSGSFISEHHVGVILLDVVAVLLSSDFAHEETITAMLIISTSQ